MTDPTGASNEVAVRSALRNILETMGQVELGKLLVAMGPQHDEDDWFRELIVDVLKTKKP
jgi:hypothetical protein